MLRSERKRNALCADNVSRDKAGITSERAPAQQPDFSFSISSGLRAVRLSDSPGRGALTASLAILTTCSTRAFIAGFVRSSVMRGQRGPWNPARTNARVLERRRLEPRHKAVL